MHTRGPWLVSGLVPGAIASLQDPSDNLLGLDVDGYAIVMDEDDARLMAAAPELLEALKMMHATGSPVGTFGDIAYAKAGAAILKAEGK